MRILVFILMGLGLGLGDIALADVPDNNALDFIGDEFKAFRDTHAGVLIDAVRTLFWNLVIIEFVFSAGMLVIRGNVDVSEVFGFLTQRVLIIGFFLWLLDNGSLFSELIVRSLATMGVMVGGISLNPADVLDQGIRVGKTLAGEVSWWNPADSLLIGIASLVIVSVFAIIAGLMLVVLCELYVLSTAGVVLLGLGGSTWTREYALAYFKTMFGLGFKIFSLQIITAIGVQIMDGWLEDLAQDNVSVMSVVATSIVLAIISNRVPDAIQGMVQGHATGNASVGHAARQMALAAQQTVNAASASRQTAIAMTNAAGAISNAVKAAQASGASGVLGTAAGAVGQLASARSATKAGNNDAGRRGKFAQLNQQAKNQGASASGRPPQRDSSFLSVD